MRKTLLIAFAIILSFTACTNRPVFWLPPEIFNPDPEPVEECKHINLTEITEYFDQSSKHYPKTGICADCGEEITRTSIEIGTAEDLAILGDDLSENNDIGCYTISIIDDIDMTGNPWPYIDLDGSKEPYNKKEFVINGNGHSIKNLSTVDKTSQKHRGFIARIWSDVTLEINNLTLIKATVTADSGSGNGVGGFVGYIEATKSVKLDNCHIIDSIISGGHWAGGIYGWAAGYDEEGDGPVHTYINISNCSVEKTQITSTDASVGGIMGHAGANPATTITVSDSYVIGCKIISTENEEEDGIKAGHILGTNGVGDTVLTNVTYDNTNTVKSNDREVNTAYGRLRFTGEGSLTIDNDKIQES